MEYVEASLVEEFGFDPDALRRKYLEERDKRLRPDGDDQYLHFEGDLAAFDADPFIDGELTRAPLVDEVDVVVVGAGFAGILTAGRLREAGIRDVRILDKAGDFGGVWYWNRYPGVRCDVESYTYMPLLAEVGYMPTEKYASGDEIRHYCRMLAEYFELDSNAYFQTKVTELSWEANTSRWIITTTRGDSIRARWVCLTQGGAPGCRPKLPGIPGIMTFRGHSFHTSRWDYSYTGEDLSRLRDKRVAVIGTGASAIQCIPHLAAASRELIVFQRTPAAVDVRGNKPTDPEWARDLKPGWQKRRVANFSAILAGIPQDEDLVADRWTQAAAGWNQASRDPLGGDSAGDPQIADFQLMEEIRARVARLVENQQKADLLKPYYNRLCKRPLYSDDYLQTFNRPNVTLVDTEGRGVERICESGLEFAGDLYEADCIVHASGFDVGGHCYEVGGFRVRGRDGVDMADKWAAGVRSLHGMYVNGFPNLLLVGSMAQAGLTINFTHLLSEQSTHVAAIIRRCADEGIATIEVRPEAEEAWARAMEAKAIDRSLFERECTPGYMNREGRPDDRPSLLASQYGGGPFEYFEICEAWRGDGFERDLEFT